MHNFGNPIPQILVDLAPVCEGPLEHWRGNTGREVSDYIAHQSVARSGVQHFTNQGPCLAEVIVIVSQRRGFLAPATAKASTGVRNAHRSTAAAMNMHVVSAC